ncbi:hypothetical protein HELRODRAFT_192951 [Helobdella robusta]|uniref:ditrans,polycis-polyprenyl diphosphate synthase [(2E,6E)-farnesyldiphosphate specific] n=1 Tax=Helobdella robusta TaxID=6412 RepID=T1FUG3_HELRO|nr:hypothetical protein HELRODRAFT_192951 [Helobdella robusta]ESN98481.1 hypothetical protein HELRODRAFT_192951 [Helobdella robusta]
MFSKLSLNMSRFSFYELILLLINSCHTLVDWLLAAIYDLVRFLLFRNRDVYRSESVKRLRKLPLHLGLVVVEEDELSIADLARIVAWSVLVGISCISVYDHRGHLKLKWKEEELRTKSTKEVEKLLSKKKTPSSFQALSSPLTQQNSSNKPNDAINLLQKKNGFHKHSTTILGSQLHVLGPKDGQSNLISVTKELCSQDNLRFEDIDVLYVDSLMQKTSGFPDPDLVFRFGSTQSMLGFLPWQLRLSEIFSLRTHKNLGFSEYFNCLDAFADIKQRCGI